MATFYCAPHVFLLTYLLSYLETNTFNVSIQLHDDVGPKIKIMGGIWANAKDIGA